MAVLHIGIPENSQKEQYSIAYLSMIAATAGFNFNHSEKDYGVDASVKEVKRREDGRINETGIGLDFQLKATQRWKCSNDNKIIYSLEVKNYNDLLYRKYGGTPLILGLLCLPKKGDFHPSNSSVSLILKHAMFWYTPSRDLEPSSNKKSVTIQIPTGNLLTARALSDLMDLYKQKGGLI